MFDEKTRTAIQRNNAGFGNAFAGRGPQINSAIGALRGLVENSQPVLRTLVRPSTRFGAFWEALEDLSATVAPVAEQQASMFVALDRTFAAFARVSRPYIQETIVKGPPTLESVTADLPALRPFLRDAGRFFTAFKPGAKALGETSPTINAALRAGIPALNRSPRLYRQLTPTAEALLDFQGEPGVFNGLDLLIDTNEVLAPAIKHIAPAQVDLPVPQHPCLEPRRRVQRIERQGELAERDRLRGARRPERRVAAAPPPRRSARARTTSCTSTPIRRTGQDGVCEAGNERYVAGQTVIGHSPKLWGTTTRGGE